MMHHIPSVLTRAAVGALRSALDGAGWVDGRATVGAQGAQVKRNRQLPEHSALARELGQRILARLEENALFFASALPLRIVPPLFNCYAGGEQYGAHVDGAVRRGAPALRTDVSVTLFLCDPADYDGGELVVHDSYGVHEVKLDAGDMILYPSSSVHQVLPVTRGERTCAFFWVQSMVRDDTKRAMLFELDQAITSLRTRLGECEETVRLSSHYHNLLRLWADT